MHLQKSAVKIISILVLSLLFGFNFNVHVAVAAVESANAIGPLEIKNEDQWQAFQRQLQIAKNMGVDAISTDIWWGKVEKNGDEKFDWTYYDRMVAEIEAAGLRWAPIMSFHQCGTNVGDVCNQPIPQWIWTHFLGVKKTDLQYKSELGNYSQEVVSLWADDIVMDEYREFMEAFEKQYGEKANIIDEINISTGTAGELRYPAYNTHDHWKYPHRGFFQAYSEPAVKSFRTYVLNKYGDLAQINTAWQTNLNSVEKINPPSDGTKFVQGKDYEDTQYGRDFIDWYNQSLIEHGKRMLEAADKAFDGAFAKVPFGMKIPGIHWQISNSQTPRIAEITTGLIRTSIDYQKDSTARGYAPLISVWNHLKNSQRKVILHFTALEMSNGIDRSVNANSRAKDLVGWVANGAASQGVTIKGENALQPKIKSKLAWKNIQDAFNNFSYNGFSVLRLAEIADNSVANEGYKNFIRQNKSFPCILPQLNLRGTNNAWNSTPMNCQEGIWAVNVNFGDSSNQSFKFDVYGDWQENYGDTNGDKIPDLLGANIPITAGAGSYKITLNPNNSQSPQNWQYSLSKIGTLGCQFPSLYIRGTNNDWKIAPMNCQNGIWQGQATFGNTSSERFKFDVYGDWRQNFGDNNADNIVESSGADILIKNGSGTYEIIFDETNNSYSLIKQ
ncbi:MAG: family 14 glycosylhydrolase [Nostocaceae cyanobacterium]|nr:family 14 glycosylhydrolase [Nostocaceae cyanobacterium]